MTFNERHFFDGGHPGGGKSRSKTPSRAAAGASGTTLKIPTKLSGESHYWPNASDDGTWV